MPGYSYQLQTLEGCSADPSHNRPHDTPQGFSCRPQPHISTSGADSEAAMDICFYVSHIHLHTVHIFSYKGLSKLFSAFFFLAKTLQLLALHVVVRICFIPHSVQSCSGLFTPQHNLAYRDNLASHSASTRHQIRGVCDLDLKRFCFVFSHEDDLMVSTTVTSVSYLS